MYRYREILPVVVAAAASVLQAQVPRLDNLSTRGQAGAGEGNMISGFVVGPGSGETLLLRAVGPGLNRSFGMTGILPDPSITVFDGSNTIISGATGWNSSAAAAMAAVGAFPLCCPKVATRLWWQPSLPGFTRRRWPGVSGDAGIALCEIYDVGPVAGSSSLINFSTRVQVGTGTGIAISGVTVAPGSGARLLLVRAVGPSLQANFGLGGVLADPAVTVLNSSGAVIASNDDWGTPVDSNSAGETALGSAFAQVGAFPLAAGGKDAALLANFPPGSYTVEVTGNGGATGLALVEIYDITPASPPAVTIAAVLPNADTSGSNPGAFVVTRSGDTYLPLTVNYSIGGTAVDGADYAGLSGTIVIPAGVTSNTIGVSPNPTLSSVASETVVLTLAASPYYSAAGSGSATVTITNLPGTLYVATLSPAPGAANSTASGTATILLNSNGTSGIVNVSYANLTSAEQAPHLTIGAPGGSSNFVFDLAYPGQVVNQIWTFVPTGVDSAAQLLAALKTGDIYVEIGSQNYPAGELTGQFVEVTGSESFTPPAPAPAIDLTHPAAADAARFLTQATFGPTLADINGVVATGYAPWIDGQMAMPSTSHLAATRADAAAFPSAGAYPITPDNRQAAWWMVSVTAPDQLRQRVAFALSEIFVVSDAAPSLANQPEALANYNDMLANDAFGNFRQLLQDVTLSPVMGNYLNLLQRAAAEPAQGTSADENYAREVIQLFTVGLNNLNPDGSLALERNGQPVPTNNQATIVQTANALTGWSYHSTDPAPSFYGAPPDWYDPMQLYPGYHDNSQKTIVGGTILPANEGGAADLGMTLDALFNHPNTGPFICRQLIQRLVTGNPSAGYVYRVAQVFADDGNGTRGDLAAVIRAILLDYEARAPDLTANVGYGKLKEPLIRETALFRAFHASAQENRFAIFTPDQDLGQAALRAPTVFNFFLPDYAPSGAIAAAGLCAPEFQITTASTAISVANTLAGAVYTPDAPAPSTILLDLSPLTSAPDDPTLVATLNLLCCGGNLSAAAQQQIISGLAGLPAGTTLAADRARFALELAITAPACAVQE